MPQLLLGGHPAGQQLRGEQPLGQVVDAAVALAARDREDAGLGQGLQQRPDLVRRSPVPVDRRPRLDVGRRQRPVLADPLQQLLDQRRVLVERLAGVRLVVAVPRDAIPRQLGRGHQREHLVVGLVERPVGVQEAVGPGPAVAGDPRQQRQVVVAARDVDRVELQRPEPVDHAHDRRRLRRQRARRGEEVAKDEEPPGDGGGHGAGLGAHGIDRTGHAARSCQVPAATTTSAGPAGPAPRVANVEGGAGATSAAPPSVKASGGRQPSIAFCLRASYSGSVIAPEALSWLSFSIWSAGVTPAAAFVAASCWVISWTSWAVTLGRLMM